ncbi:MAG: hypothetical protein COV48_15555 [Elusimicrobia bacterium CG11_big_fil_rev_8_21_14_0_20_64_6]|nr:MAG: hypothetical protein COV48_15555 [Elusimicrobia bacterium CG11_big_fil_rev_8_21_14_0_20_64_6]
MNMTTLMFALVASLIASPVFAEAPAVNFDQGIDASAILAQAKEAAKADAEVVDAQYMGGRRTVEDCVSVSFGANDPAASPRFSLHSQEYVEECYQTGDPRNGGGRQCYERPGMSYHELASVTLQDRKPLLPWERDTFRVCLDGPWLSIYDIETAYDYRLISGGSYNGAYILAPGKKIAQRPDPVGVLGELDAAMKFTLKDKWASYYAGESIEIKYTLKKDVPNWFDPTITEGILSAAVAESYLVDLSKNNFQNGKKYYVEYSIRRIGTVSNNKFTRTLESNKMTRTAMSLAFNK